MPDEREQDDGELAPSGALEYFPVEDAVFLLRGCEPARYRASKQDGHTDRRSDQGEHGFSLMQPLTQRTQIRPEHGVSPYA